MQKISNTQQCMASLAVFRKLYENEKDIYSVISAFVNQIIIENGYHLECELSDLTNRLNSDYGFDVYPAVVKNAIKRLPYANVVNGGLVNLNEEILSKHRKPLEDYQDRKNKNDKIYAQLIAFVEKDLKAQLDSDSQKELITDFCNYIVDETAQGKYNKYVYCFILDNKKNPEFIEQIQMIREGAISYVGLSFQTNDNSIDVLDAPLTIYLDTEILFHLAGFNGDLSKQLFDDFYSLVGQVNRQSRDKKKKDIVKLQYFQETFDEICGYFKSAEDIISQHKAVDYSKTAMTNILHGCNYTYEIQEKLGKFKSLLDDKNITKANYSTVYDVDKYDFIIDQKKFIDEENISSKVDLSLKLLQQVRTRRGGNTQRLFRTIGHILLTGKKLTIQIAMDSSVRNEKDIPLATTLSFLTNRFWFSLHKGLGSMNLTSFDIIAKTQIALSTLVTDKIGEMYDKVNQELKDGIITKENATQKLVYLKDKVVKPEDLTTDSFETDGYLSFISEDDIDAAIANNKLSEKNYQEEVENSKKREKESAKEAELEKQKVRKMVINRMNQLNTEYQRIYDKEIKDYDEEKEKELKRKMRCRIVQAVSWILGFLFFIVLLYYVNKEFGTSPVFGAIIGLIIFALPFIRPIVNHVPIKDAFLVVLSKKRRLSIKEEFDRQFHEVNRPPLLKVFTYEEVEKIMLEKDN